LWPTNVHIRKFGISTLLPAVGSLRDIGRALSLRARVQVKDGHIDQAIRTIKVGLAMARHLEEGSTLIEGLVGMAIAQMIFDRVEELIQHEKGPNLYWALTELPRPMVSLRRGLRYERYALRFTLPKIYELTRETYTKEAWQVRMNDVVRIWGEVQVFSDASVSQDQDEVRLGVALFSAVRYPDAKRQLIDNGKDAKQIESMPVTQVVLMHETERLRHWSDETFKWFHLPYWQAEPGIQKTEQAFKVAAARKESILAKLLLPAISSAIRTQVLLDQRIASLRTVEAIRMHAASNEGNLPDRLSSITLVPVPLDPVSGKSFDYRIEEGIARLTGKQPRATRSSQGQLNLEIHMK
jgi:hypothetical protein